MCALPNPMISRSPLAFKMKRKTYIDQLADISRLEIPEHRGLVEVSHVGDILNIILYNMFICLSYFNTFYTFKFFHLRRVDLHKLTRLESLFLPAYFDIGLE